MVGIKKLIHELKTSQMKLPTQEVKDSKGAEEAQKTESE